MYKIIIGFIFLSSFVQLAAATPINDKSISVFPLVDGTVSSFGIVHDDGTIGVSHISRGILEFQLTTPLDTRYRVWLSMSPYSLPLHGNPYDVYGYIDADGEITAEDYERGAFLRIWDFPHDITWGQEDFFEVTEFVLASQFTTFGFSIRGDSIGAFNSTEINSGTGPRLIIHRVPEPSALLLLMSALFITPLRKRAGIK